MTNKEFIAQARLALEMNTMYATGAFGAPVGVKNNRARYAKNTKKKFPEQAKKIEAAADNVFLFDCIGYVEGILWGWDAVVTALYGGAEYKKDGIPDFSIKNTPKYCSVWTDSDCTDPDAILPGEVLVTDDNGHIAIYEGSGYILESSIRGTANVQRSLLGSRKWRGHGQLKWLDFVKEEYYQLGALRCPNCDYFIKLFTKDLD